MNFNRLLQKSVDLRSDLGLDKVDRLYHIELTGVPSTYGIDPWGNEQYQQLPHGAIGYDRFGNKYRYVANNSTNAMVLGNLQSRAAIDTQFVDMAVQAAAPLITTGTAPFPNNKVAVTLGSSATTANQFTGGIAIVSVTPGIGQMFSIKQHDVAASGTCNFYFYENLSVALTTSSKLTVLKSPYKDVILTPTTWTGEPIGVALNIIPASYFGWVGTHGVFGARSDATGTQSIGRGIVPSVTTAGDITVMVAATLQNTIGSFLVAGVSAQVEPQWFNIN